MQFTNEQRIALLVKTGILIRFSAGTIFGNTNPHFAVVVNSDPRTQEAVVVVCATSQIDKLVRFVQVRNFPQHTVVRIKGGTQPHFGKDTAFDCNRPEKVQFKQLAKWLNANLIEIPINNTNVDTKLLDEIRAGIVISEMVEQDIIDMLT